MKQVDRPQNYRPAGGNGIIYCDTCTASGPVQTRSEWHKPDCELTTLDKRVQERYDSDMTYPVHLEMTHDFAEWLVSFLIKARETELDGYDDYELSLFADAIQDVSDGKYDIAGSEPDHFQVTSP